MSRLGVSWIARIVRAGTGKRGDSGVTLAATAIFIFALLAITAIAVEVARLTATATEVQVAADSAALAGALAISQGQSAQAVSWGQSAAGANSADGRSVDAAHGATVQIDVGNYDPAANPHFSTTCSPGVDCNAAMATVTVSNVNYIIATILNGQSGANVQKTAVAAAECQGGAYPFPIAVCDNALTEIPQGDLCGPLTAAINIQPDSAQNGCWTSLGSNNTSAAFAESIFPPQCGGTEKVYTTLGQDIDLHTGLSDDVWKALQCCVQCQNVHDFTVPVIGNCAGVCTATLPVVGFATLHIANATDVSRNTQGNTNCNSFSFCSNGVQVPNAGISQIQASQVCKSDVPGAPGGTNCKNFANTVVVLGQLP
jgi:hypothetical protein